MTQTDPYDLEQIVHSVATNTVGWVDTIYDKYSDIKDEHLKEQFLCDLTDRKKEFDPEELKKQRWYLIRNWADVDVFPESDLKLYEIEDEFGSEEFHAYLISEMDAMKEEQEFFNGFTNHGEGKLRITLFNSVGLKSTYDLMYYLNLRKVLGEEHWEKLFWIFDTRNDYDIFQFLVDTDTEGSPMYSIEECKELIDGTIETLEFVQDSIYQSFYFKSEIKEHFCAGNNFLSHNADMSPEELTQVFENVLEDESQFFPTLRSHIESLLPEDSFMSDLWEFGSDEVSLYYDISKSAYSDFMAKFKAWVDYAELGHLISWEVKDVSWPQERPIIEYHGWRLEEKIKGNALRLLDSLAEKATSDAPKEVHVLHVDKKVQCGIILTILEEGQTFDVRKLHYDLITLSDPYELGSIPDNTDLPSFIGELKTKWST